MIVKNLVRCFQLKSTTIRFLIATDLTLDEAAITSRIFQKRWKVREYQQSLKQHTALGGSPTKTIETQANHFSAAIVAYVKLETLKFKTGHGHFRLNAVAMLFAIVIQECIRTVQKRIA